MSEPKDQKNQKRENPTAEEVLAPQIGTTPDQISREHKFDSRRVGKLEEVDPIWIAYFRQKAPEEGGNFLGSFIDDYMNLNPSVEGWNVNKMIQMVGAGKGVTSGAEFVKKPGFFGRNITNRKWKEKAENEGKTIIE